MQTQKARKRLRSARTRWHRKELVRKGDSISEVLKLRLEHIIVLQGLENANRSYQRAVGVSEIIQQLSTTDINRLEKIYHNPLTSAVTKILTLLMTRSLVFSPGVYNRRRSYGSSHVLSQEKTDAPLLESRRVRVLGLVRSAVAHYGRAVRNLDIISHAVSYEPVQGLVRSLITHSVLSLAATGELSIIGRTRGEGKGHNLYLPFDMNVDLYKPSQPLTWLDEVAQIVENLWTERVEDAKRMGIRPRPFTTGDVRARIVKSSFLTKRELRDPQIIVDAVKNLATTRNALLRKVKRKGQKALLWVPVGVEDHEIDFENSYANDGERIGVAVERAARRLGTPVTVRDVHDEIDRDPALKLVNSSSLFKALAYQARETFEAHTGTGIKKRSTRRVFRVGRAGANVYYDTLDSPSSQCFVEFQRIRLHWSNTHSPQELENIRQASLPSVATGRALLLLQKLDSVREDLSTLLAKSGLDCTTRLEAKDLRDDIHQLKAEVEEWLVTPGDTIVSVPVIDRSTWWTAADFLAFIKPLYPLAKNWSPHQLIRSMYKRVRLVQNPDFQHRFLKNSARAAEFYFDRTDALIYAAKRWGGPECSLQATLAQRELGLLRDVTFVFPALADRNFEIKLAAIACLAFLWSDEGNRRLKHLVEEDPDAGIRQSALWAYCFAGGKEGTIILTDKANNDPNHRVREFSRQALDVDVGWFKI